MSATQSVPVLHAQAPRRFSGEFLRAALRRGTPAQWAWAAVAITALNVARDVGAGFHAGGVASTQLSLQDPWTFVLVTAALCVALVVAVLMADEAVARGAPQRRSYLVAAAAASTVVTVLQCALRFPRDPDLRQLPHSEVAYWCADKFASIFADQLLICAMVLMVYISLRNARDAAHRRYAAELARSEAQRHTLKSRLQAMQARVEPQFLSNTLHEVRQRYDTDAAAAGRMLDDLIAYLRAALPQMRDDSSTLGQEVALVRAYLDIVRAQRGRRLRFSIDVPPALAAARLPPMMLLPLIDHALNRAGAPPVHQEWISIEAQQAGSRLRVCVSEHGAGFAPGRAEGALAPIAERLQALYGGAAALRLQVIEPGVSRAVLEIPDEATDRGHR